MSASVAPGSCRVRASAVPSAAHVRSRSSVLTLEARPDGAGSAYSAPTMDAWTAIDMVEKLTRVASTCNRTGPYQTLDEEVGGAYVLFFAPLDRQYDKCAEPVSYGGANAAILPGCDTADVV